MPFEQYHPKKTNESYVVPIETVSMNILILPY